MALEGMVRTVLGDIAPADLGWCQCHEHVFWKGEDLLSFIKPF